MVSPYNSLGSIVKLQNPFLRGAIAAKPLLMRVLEVHRSSQLAES
jgi:hypothetical protein